MKKKRIETSKKIVLYCDVMLSLAVIATFIALFMGLEVSSVVMLDGTLAGLVTAAHGFYYVKAKAENIIKISKAYDISIKDAKQAVDEDGLEFLTEFEKTGGEGHG